MSKTVAESKGSRALYGAVRPPSGYVYGGYGILNLDIQRNLAGAGYALDKNGNTGLEVILNAIPGMVSSYASRVPEHERDLEKLRGSLKVPKTTRIVPDIAMQGNQSDGQGISTLAEPKCKAAGLLRISGQDLRLMRAFNYDAPVGNQEFGHFGFSGYTAGQMSDIERAHNSAKPDRGSCPMVQHGGLINLFKILADAACEVDALAPLQLREQTTPSGLIIV